MSLPVTGQASEEWLMASVIAFDVNETLLDLRALDAPFEALLGSTALRPQWFALMLQLAFVGGLTGRYTDFTTAQRGALAMIAEREGVSLSTGEIDGLVGRMSSLPPHPEVPGALARLSGTGLQMVALTNSVQAVADAQLASAGLDRVLPRGDLGRRRAAPEAGAAALPGGRPGLRRGHRAGPAGGRPRLGCRRGAQRRVPGRLRGPPGDGPQPAR